VIVPLSAASPRQYTRVRFLRALDFSMVIGAATFVTTLEDRAVFSRDTVLVAPAAVGGDAGRFYFTISYFDRLMG
jgi:hypothetical protein